jgi:hypothetical protein
MDWVNPHQNPHQSPSLMLGVPITLALARHEPLAAIPVCMYNCR